MRAVKTAATTLLKLSSLYGGQPRRHLVTARYQSTSQKSTRAHSDKDDMAKNLRVTFLGSSSGGGPSESRNCSSLVADVLCDGTLWSESACTL